MNSAVAEAIQNFERAHKANDPHRLAQAAEVLWDVAIPETMATLDQAVETMLLARNVGEILRDRRMFLQAVPFHHVLCKASMGLDDDDADADIENFACCLIEVARDRNALAALIGGREVSQAELDENEPLTRKLIETVGSGRESLDLLRLAIRAFPALGIV